MGDGVGARDGVGVRDGVGPKFAKPAEASRSQPKPANFYFLLEEASHILWVGVRV